MLLVLTIIFILLFEWFYNHPALRYGGFCLIASIFFILTSLFLERFSISKKHLIKKTMFFIIITALVFVLRNINRINYEVEAYGYQPLKMTYYYIDPTYFTHSEKIKELIKQYKECNNHLKNCEKMKDLKLKKIFGQYVIYKNND